MTSITVIQSRLNSSRLPAKALLPVSGVPMVVLAAKRAANTGRKVLVVTSQNSADDHLCQVLDAHGISHFRGSLENTLQRFVSALKRYSDDTVVTRLTADNVFPDGQLLDEMEEDFQNSGAGYLGISGAESGLPYGLSAEIMFLSDLRNAFAHADSTYDQEHVTPYIVRKYGNLKMGRYANFNMANFRCTVDNFDDYISILDVFSNFENPVSVTWQELVRKLPLAHMQPQVSIRENNIVLGTAQLGGPYGIANTSSISFLEKINLIRTAIANGIGCLDTAVSYGESEPIIGEALDGGWASRVQVVTKLSPLQHLPKNISDDGVKFAVESSILNSCRNLRRTSLDTVLLHRAEHLTAWNGVVWERLLEFVGSGVIEKLGVSVQTPEELISALEYDQIQHIQLPFNILDNRWLKAIQRIEKLKSSRHVIVHVRSIFLQGLLLSKKRDLWGIALVENGDQMIKWLSDLVCQFNRENLVDLCLAYVQAQPWVDGIVLGADNLDQLMEVMQLFSNQPLSQEDVEKVVLSRPDTNGSVLNPTLWRRS